MSHQFPIKVFLYLLLAGLIVHGINYTIDPLQVFRKQSMLTPLYSEKQHYQVPGLVNTHASHSTNVIVGSSMTANFRSSVISETLGGPSLKLSINGSTQHEQLFVTDLALKNSDGAIKRVIWGLDVWRFNETPEVFSQTGGQYPMYLYGEGIERLRYTLNVDTAIHSVQTVLSNYSPLKFFQKTDDLDSVNTWDRITGCKPVFLHYSTIAKRSGFIEDAGFAVREENFKANIEQLKRLIQSYPDVEFVYFYPPYSVVRHKHLMNMGGMEVFLELRHLIYSELSDLPNTFLVDTQFRGDIIANLDYYKDVGHYDGRVNQIILNEIAASNYVQSASQLNDNSRQLMAEIASYNLASEQMECASQ